MAMTSASYQSRCGGSFVRTVAPTSMSAQPQGCFTGAGAVVLDGSVGAAGADAGGLATAAVSGGGLVGSVRGWIPLFSAAVCNSKNRDALMKGTNAFPLANTFP